MAIALLNDCNPGIEPFEFNVLVYPEETETVTKGGIILTDRQREVEGIASVRGLLVAVSPAAFSYHDWPDSVKLPEAGDHVIFAKYAGTLITGDDGKEYRICKDKDITAIVRRRAEALKAVA